MPNDTPKLYYALVTDTGTQWFTYIVMFTEIEGKKRVAESIEVPPNVRNDFISSIYSRPASLDLKIRIDVCDDFAGTYLSLQEYSRLKKIIKLYPAYKEYLELGKSI